MNNSSFSVPASSGLTININKVIGTQNDMGPQGQGPQGQGPQGQQGPNGQHHPQQQQARYNNTPYNNGQYRQQQYGQQNAGQYNNGQYNNGQYQPTFLNNGQQQYGQQNAGQYNNGPYNNGQFNNGQYGNTSNQPTGNPFADLNQAWYDAEQARNRYVEMASQLNDQAYLSYVNQNPTYGAPGAPNGQYPNQNQQALPPYMQQNQTQHMTPPPPFKNQPPMVNGTPGAPNNQTSPFPTVVPDGPLPAPTINDPLLEEPLIDGEAAPVDQAPQPAPAVKTAPVETAPVETAPTEQPADATQQPEDVKVNEDMALYQKLSKKPTTELQGMLKNILSMPAESAQAPQDEKLYSLQTIEYVLDILKDRPDAATPETFGLLKELGEMSKVMATMPGADIPQWKREDSKIIWMETLWAAAKLDSFLDNVAVKKLPGFSTMIQPILSGKEEVPPLILMAATQAVSPDVFKYSNDATVQKLLKNVEARASKAVNRSGKRKLWTLGLRKYKQLNEQETMTYNQVAQIANAIRNGQPLSQVTAGTNPNKGNIGNPNAMQNFDPAKIDPKLAAQMAQEMDNQLAKMAPEERQKFMDAISGVAQEAAKNGIMNGTSGDAQPSQKELDALLASLTPPPATANAPAAAVPVMNSPRLSAVG